MNWLDVNMEKPVPNARILIWFGDAMFGARSETEGWSFDFLPPDSAYSRITHFCEVMGPAVDAAWLPIYSYTPGPGESVILWCGHPVVGYLSSDLDDPERDGEGWVIDYRVNGASKPTHIMRITPPVE